MRSRKPLLCLSRTLVVLLLLAIASCKHSGAAATASETKSQDSRKSQCGGSDRPSFQGVCRVTEISGRLDTKTDNARASLLSDVQTITFSVPAGSESQQAAIHFAGATGPLAAWSIDQALDLYSRRGCLAQVSGGIFGEGYAPVLTVKALLNVHDEGQTGFAEVSDHRADPVIHASLRLSCDWQR